MLGKDGVLETLEKQRKDGRLRTIGMSGHARPPLFLKMQELLAFGTRLAAELGPRYSPVA